MLILSKFLLCFFIYHKLVLTSQRSSISYLKLSCTGVPPAAIAVQSPYVAQVQLLRDKVDELPMATGVEVATIDSFQGREADAVIISMVSCHSTHVLHVYMLLWIVLLFHSNLCLIRTILIN